MQFLIQRGNVTSPLGSNHRKGVEGRKDLQYVGSTIWNLALKIGGFRGSDSTLLHHHHQESFTWI